MSSRRAADGYPDHPRSGLADSMFFPAFGHQEPRDVKHHAEQPLVAVGRKTDGKIWQSNGSHCSHASKMLGNHEGRDSVQAVVNFGMRVLSGSLEGGETSSF